MRYEKTFGNEKLIKYDKQAVINATVKLIRTNTKIDNTKQKCLFEFD